jgi:hypothetical protein
MESRGAAVTRMADAVERVTVPLRMGDGVDDVALDQLRSALASAAAIWQGDLLLPKSLVSFLVELVPTVESASYLYSDERANRIRDIAEELRELIGSVIR